MKKKKMTSSFFLCVCIFFPFHLDFLPKVPEDLERSFEEVVFFSPPRWLMFLTIFRLDLRHVTHSTRTTRDPEKKRDFTTIVPAIKRNHREKKQKRQGWWSPFAVCKSPDGVRFQCLRLSAEPIGAVYLRRRRRRRKREGRIDRKRDGRNKDTENQFKWER